MSHEFTHLARPVYPSSALIESLKGERDAAYAERDSIQGRNNAQAETIRLLQGETVKLRAERDKANDSAKFWENRFDVCAGQLKGAEIEAVRLSEIAGAANTARYAAEGERDSAVTESKSLADAANAYRLERNEAGTKLGEARKGEAYWRDQAASRTKERARLRTANTDILVMLDGARTERDRAQADIPAHVDKIKRLSAELIQTVADGNQLRVDRDKAVCDLMDRNNELLEARLELAKLQDRPGIITLKRPGRIEALEARLTTLESLVKAR